VKSGIGGFQYAKTSYKIAIFCQVCQRLVPCLFFCGSIILASSITLILKMVNIILIKKDYYLISNIARIEVRDVKSRES
jgi:hypothetical protein